ncbi:MAG TPA: 2-succinyl-6-hydroxy-2,4-cyclohexadiene-1-carboxylate synthase [Myxococcaceae bacterium]|nr:2-succinyl-6-hydroxy-2,4-cyclohexadiene-1-carboxylate synthase [Myxococcaceae bacterium]
MKLAYGRWGKGSMPLMLIHGFTGSRASWDHLRPLMGSEVRALAVDLPGHGESEPCSLSGEKGFAQTVAALRRAMDEFGAAPISILGYSQGARLALALAIQSPDRVRRLILESGTAGLIRSRDRTMRRASDEALARQIEVDGIASFVERWKSLPLFAGVRKLPAELAESVNAGRLACSPRGLASSLRSVGLGIQPNYWPMLPALRVPTLLLTGRRDAKFTGIARAMVREIPMAWLRSFDNAWHAPHLEAASLFASEVLSFVGASLLEAPLFDSEATA